MSNETKKQIAKAAPNRWLVFCILTFSGGIAFKLSSMKDMLLVAVDNNAAPVERGIYVGNEIITMRKQL